MSDIILVGAGGIDWLEVGWSVGGPSEFLLVPSIPPAVSHRGCIITALLHGGLWWAVVGRGGMKWGDSPMAWRMMLAQYLPLHPCNKGFAVHRPRPWFAKMASFFDVSRREATMRHVVSEEAVDCDHAVCFTSLVFVIPAVR